MKCIKTFFSVLLFYFSVHPFNVFSGTTGILEGVVRDKETTHLLLGVNVLIQELKMGTTTDANGYFQINNILAGRYTVKISMIGYRQFTYKNITILPDRRTKVQIDLIPSSIEMEAMEVQAERPLIETNTTGTTHTMEIERISQMPISTAQDVLKWQAGVTQEGNVRGGRTTEVLYLLDGLPIQDVLGGGIGSNVPRSSIVQMSMATGGFDAEYGNALSGVVNIITRSGGDKSTFLVRADNDAFYGGKENDHASEIELTLGGPLIRDKLFYFMSGNFYYTDTRYWQDFKEFFSSPISRDWNGFGKLDYRISSSTSLSGSFLFSSQKWHDYEFSWRYNLAGIPLRMRDSYRGALQITSTISKNAFYNIQLSHYYLDTGIGQGNREDVKPIPYEYDFFLQYIINGNRSWWARSKQYLTTLKGDYSFQWDANNLFRAGVDVNQYVIHSDILRYETQKTYFGKPILTLPLLNYSTTFDYYPRAGSAYIQNKFEVNKEEGLINVGLRFDFLDPRAERPIIDTIPVGSGVYEQRVVRRVPATFKYKFSPRIGISAPVSPNVFIFVNYGEYFQYPLFDYLYSGLDPNRVSNGVRAVLGNPDLEPERTKAWELSVRYSILDEFVLSVTYYQKQTTNLIDTKTFIATNSRVAGDYGFAEYVNNPYAHSNGFEFTVSRMRGKIINGEISYSISEAKGVSEYVNQTANYEQWGLPFAPEEYYLSWDQRHSIKANLTFMLPWDINASLLFQYSTGKPFTYFPSKDGFTSSVPVEQFLPNNRRMDDIHFLDMKVNKRFSIETGFRTIHFTLYADMRNVFNDKNVRWVDSSGRIGGELGDPSAYYSPRRSRIGCSIEL